MTLERPVILGAAPGSFPVSTGQDNSLSSSRSLRRLVSLAIARPGLWPTMLGAAWRFRRSGWYRRAPFLPLPPAEYLDWRMHTAYGESGEPRREELERYLRWSAHMSRPGRSG
jgi:hypothetical protein